MSYQFPAYQLDALSGASEIMPLYRLPFNNEGVSSRHSSFHEATSPLSSLDSLGKTTIGFSVKRDKTDTQRKSTDVGNRSQAFQTETVDKLSCPAACPCICHLPSPFPASDEERPSVIMSPVARNYRASSVTHVPLQEKVRCNLMPNIYLLFTTGKFLMWFKKLMGWNRVKTFYICLRLFFSIFL